MTKDRPVGQQFGQQLRESLEALKSESARSHSGELWSDRVETTYEKHLAALADLYWGADCSQRSRIHDAIGSRLIMQLFMHVRRFAILMHGPDDDVWLRRGLALAAIEGGRADDRDLIVSLVLLRHGAERNGIDARRMFDAAIAMAPEPAQAIFENAREHAESDVRITVREFGPPQWRRRESNGTEGSI